MKLLPLTVYRFSLGDCTNGGVSGKHNTIYMVHPQGHVDPEKVDKALIFEPQNRGGDYWALRPLVKDLQNVGPMHGGNLAQGDSRDNGRIYRIHDRFETPQQYRDISSS